MGVALNALLDRLHNLRDPDHPPPVIDGLSLRSPHEVRVRFDAEQAA